MAKYFKNIADDFETNDEVRNIFLESKRFLLDYKRGAINEPIKACFENLKHNKAIIEVFLNRMVRSKDKKLPSIKVIADATNKYRKKWAGGAELDATIAYTENWGCKRLTKKVRDLWVKFMSRPVMDIAKYMRHHGLFLGQLEPILSYWKPSWAVLMAIFRYLTPS